MGKMFWIILILALFSVGILIYFFSSGKLEASSLWDSAKDNNVDGFNKPAGTEVTSGDTTYTQEGKTICKDGRCTTDLYQNTEFVYEDKNWKNFKDAVSLIDDGWTCNVIKNISTDPDVECLDFNSTSITLKVSDKTAKSQVTIPIKYESSNPIVGKVLKNITTVSLKDDKETQTIKVYVPLGTVLHIGDKSTIVTITNPSGFNIMSGDVSHYDSTWTLGGGETSSIAITINTTLIPDTATIDSVEFAFMSGLVCADAPVCTEGEVGAGIDSSGTFTIVNSSNFNSYGNGETLTNIIQASPRVYSSGSIADYHHYWGPGSTEWGGISSYVGVGFNSTQWITGNSNATTDLQAQLATNNFSFGIRAGNYWNENTGEAPQNAVRLRVTYTTTAGGLAKNITACGTISSSGTYRLNNTIRNTSASPCIILAVPNIVIDCEGRLIDGISSSVQQAIGTGSYSSNKDNITIRNCQFENFNRVIALSAFSNVTIEHNKFSLFSPSSSSSDYALYSSGMSNLQNNVYYNNNTIILGANQQLSGILYSGKSLIINNSIFNTTLGNNSLASETSSYCISYNFGDTPYLSMTNSYCTYWGKISYFYSQNGYFYNNYFSVNYANPITERYDTYRQNWNTSFSTATNIVGGNYIGGNYWGNYGWRPGFSGTCLDVVAPIGICDTNYTMSYRGLNDIDYLPLSSNIVHTDNPSVSLSHPNNNSYLNGNIFIEAIVNDSAGIYFVNFSYYNVTLGWTQIAVDYNSPYQTLLGTTNIGTGQYFLKANVSDNKGLTQVAYLTINIDKSIPSVSNFSVRYPGDRTAIKQGENVTLWLNTTDGSGSGINNSKVNVQYINGTVKNITMKLVQGSQATGQYSLWELNVTAIPSIQGTLQAPFYIFDNVSTPNVARGSYFEVKIDNTPPYFSEMNTSPLVPTKNNPFTLFANIYDNYNLRFVNFSSNITGTWVNETISLTGSFPITYFQASIEKTLVQGNYSYRFFYEDEVGWRNSTPVSNVEVITYDLPPGNPIEVYNPSPENNYISTGLNQNFSWYYSSSGSNATNCSLFFDGLINQTILSPNNNTFYNFTIPKIDIGTWSWNVECIDNQTLDSYMGTNKNIIVPDPYYPIFSNYKNNNGTFSNQNSIFNVTILDISSAWLTLNGVNYSTTNVTSFYNTTIALGAGNYIYHWGAYGNGTSNNMNLSQDFFFTVKQADNVKPNLVIVQPTDRNYTTRIIGLNYTANDTNLQRCWYRNGTELVNYTLTCGVNATITYGADGSYTLWMFANDSYGNLNSTSRNFQIDTTSVSVTIVSPSTNVYYNNLTIDYNVTLDGNGTCSYSLDDFKNNISMTHFNNTYFNYTNSSITNGKWNINFSCIDTWGNLNMSVSRVYNLTEITDSYPQVNFSHQIPADLNLTNFIGVAGVNVTYNISDDKGINFTTLFYKINSTVDNIMFYQNGSSNSGYYRHTSLYNNSVSWVWNLLDNEVLPGTYNFGEVSMEATNHTQSSLSGANDLVSVEFYNVSNATYGYYEMMINISTITGSLRMYYCNSTYAHSNSPAGNPNCILFSTLTNSTYNHRHTVDSAHNVFSFPVNASTGMVGTIKTTPTSYFIARGTAGQTWNFFHILNTTRTNAMRTSANNGLAWSSQTYTIDAHLHQFYTNTSLWYYACANDTINQQNCSVPRQDLLELGGLPPSSPDVYAPIEAQYYLNNITNINYTAVESPNGYDINFYNITLYNSSLTYNRTIVTNNSLKLGYLWNASIADGYVNGSYVIRVEACDVRGLCSFGFSANFTLTSFPTEVTDTTPPTWTNCRNFSQQANSSFADSITATDAGGIGRYQLNYTAIFNVTWTTGDIYNASKLDTLQIYNLNLTVNDTSGNRASCFFYINITEIIPPAPPSNATVTQAAICRYKQFVYYNLKLPWYKQQGCI